MPDPAEPADGTSPPTQNAVAFVAVPAGIVVERPPGVVERPAGAAVAADVLLGLGATVVGLTWRVSRPVRRLASAAVDVAARAAPDSITSVLAERGERVRGALDETVRGILQRVVPRVVESALAPLDLTALVKQHVDLDRLAAELDVGAVVDRVDLDEIVGRVDLDAVVGKVDLDAVVARVDIDAVLDRVDLDAVAGRLDLDAVAAGLDLDGLVAKVDIEAVLARLDLAGIAEEVIAEIDLPEIMRMSSGTLASEAIRGVRSGGMQADEAVGRFVDRVLRRRRSGPAAETAP